MQRYFVDKNQFFSDKVIIAGDDVHHITKVMRNNIGDKIICSNGHGQDAIVEIIEIENKQIVCKITDEHLENREPRTHITLVQGLPKADKMELIIQKGTEVGVSAFLPFTSERTIVQLDQKKEQKRLERWDKIAKEAAEQAHRSLIPKILPVVSFKELLKLNEDGLTLIAYEKENSRTLYQVLEQNNNVDKVFLIIGPEGGFSEQEIIAAEKNGAVSVSLGKRILRTETAGIVGVANILYHLDNS